jgi:hypothetical protein
MEKAQSTGCYDDYNKSSVLLSSYEGCTRQWFELAAQHSQMRTRHVMNVPWRAEYLQSVSARTYTTIQIRL